jgi:rhomboid domain-containing protein 1
MCVRNNVCMHPYSACMLTEHCSNFMQGGAWGRLFWSTLLHADEWHLYYNMTSLLWKGLQLETSMGSVRFLCLIVELWAATSALMVALYWACNKYFAALLPGLAQGYLSLCAVGFSGVLFGMKTVNNAHQTGWESVALPYVGRIQMPPKVMLLPGHDRHPQQQ